MKHTKEILILKDLPVNSDRLLAWTREDSFPMKLLDDENKKKLNDIAAVFVSFEGNRGDEIELMEDHTLIIKNKLFDDYNLFVGRFLSHSKAASYLVVTEHGLGVKNRLRSYKGILPHEIKKISSYIQTEVIVQDNCSIIVAIIEISEQNRAFLVESLLDNYTSCILNSFEADIFSETFIKSFPFKYMSHSGTSTINFLSLVMDFCEGKRTICRVGGDGGDEELSFQVFCKSDIADFVYLQVENSI